MNNLGVQLYSVRSSMADDADAALGRLARIGYSVVEPTYGLLGGDPPAFRRMLDRHNLSACSLHGPLLGPTRSAVAEAAAAIGAQTVVVPVIPEAEFSTAAGVTRTAERLAEAADSLATQGLLLAYHNHRWELSHRPGGQPALELLAALLPPTVTLELDVYWAAVGGANVPELLRSLGDRVRFLHIKDGPSTVDDPMTAVGAGKLPIQEILAAAPVGAQLIVEIDRCKGDVFTALAESATYLTQDRS